MRKKVEVKKLEMFQKNRSNDRNGKEDDVDCGEW